jgi:hypothetical protein
VVSRDLVVVPHSLDVISVINDHVLDRIKVDGQGVLVVESDASHPVMTDIRKQIIPEIKQKSQNSDNWFRCTEQTYK